MACRRVTIIGYGEWSLGIYELGSGRLDCIYRTPRMQLVLIAGSSGTALDGMERMVHRCQLIVELGATLLMAPWPIYLHRF